jgi:hypothetical protein
VPELKCVGPATLGWSLIAAILAHFGAFEIHVVAGTVRLAKQVVNDTGANAMLDGCANPSCHATFKYLGTGKLFLQQPDSVLSMSSEEITQRCYWLCESCCKLYRIDFSEMAPVVTPLSPTEVGSAQAQEKVA